MSLLILLLMRHPRRRLGYSLGNILVMRLKCLLDQRREEGANYVSKSGEGKLLSLLSGQRIAQIYTL